tara:strand:+ start:1375 stop:1998 length:624 start_codon:yes stop_codon:yes gene_type:complete
MQKDIITLLGIGAVAFIAYSVVRKQSWTVQGEVGRTEVFPVNKQSLAHVQGLSHDYLAKESHSLPVKTLAEKVLDSRGVRPNENHRQTAMVLHRFVADDVPFIDDPMGFERMVSPAELAQQILNQGQGTVGGDCDDKAVLLAALARSQGIEASVSFLDTDSDGEIDHAMAVMILDGQPVHAETTIPGAAFGWKPDAAREESLLAQAE